MVLSWVGNHYFGDEALRRGEATPSFTTVVGSALQANLLHGVITAESVELCVAESGVPLDEEQRQALADIKLRLQCAALCDFIGRCWANSPLSLPPESLLGSEPHVRPRRLALYCVPTRALREEVVLELIKSKALVWLSLVLVAVCLSFVSDSSIQNLN